MQDTASSWVLLPEELLLRVFSCLPDGDLLAAGCTCHRWHDVSVDSLLWKERLYRKYPPTQLLDRSLQPFGDEPSFLSVYRSFEEEVPRVCVQTVQFHEDEVLHVSFSNNGQFVCSSSKDGRASIWTVTSQFQLKLYDSIDFRDAEVVIVPWIHVVYSEFNSDDTLLLLSAGGLHTDPNQGQIAVYEMQGKELIQKFANRPFDIFGTWLNDRTVLHGNVRFLGHATTETTISASHVYSAVRKNICQLRCGNGAFLRQINTLTCKAADQGPDRDQILLYTRGQHYCVPHQLACCHVPLHVIQPTSKSSLREPNSETIPTKDSLLVEFKGHVIGLAASPDQQYLYVNCRPHADEHVEPGPVVGPAIVSDVAMRVYRIKSAVEWQHVQTLLGHRCFSEAKQCFFIFLDVGEQFVASGAEDKNVHIWHRQSGAKVACLSGHRDVVNSVTFNPTNPHMLVSGSDDYTVKVWIARKLAVHVSQ